MPRVAVIDACVLYSAALRDLFLWLARSRVYYARWTDRIHHEWIESVLGNRPDLSRERLERTCALMNANATGSLIDEDAELAETLTLPDANDRHVLAAAISANASLIVTFNLSDFPSSALSSHNVRALHPDEFLCWLFDEEPGRFLAAVGDLIANLRNPPRSWQQQVEILRAQGLPEIASRLAAHIPHHGSE